MNIRQAILKAADHIEARPSEFDFDAYLPSGCGTPGCALGWVSYFLGKTRDGHHGALPALGLKKNMFGAMDFYIRMEDIFGGEDWKDTINCVKTLRAYAERYHPAKEQSPPDWNTLATPTAGVLPEVSA